VGGAAMSIYVYLAGPISGTSIESQSWRSEVRDALAEGIIGIDPLRCEPVLNGEIYKACYMDELFGTPRAISSKNFIDVQRADIVLAYLPTVSIGTLLEIGWCMAMHKPCIVVSDVPKIHQNAVLQGKANWVFETLDDAVATINGIYAEYSNG
jgi:nucleoside 2-deoxyribosyltransferase